MAMAKVHPQLLFPSSSSSSTSYHTSKQETFTVWLKSLVLNGKGCTVFDSNGRIVYRVDNYNCKASDEIFLMDLKGKVLFTILRKQWKLLGFWEGYRPSMSGGGGEASKSKKRPGFQVRKTLVGMFGGGDSTCKVTAEGLDKNQQSHDFKIQSWSNNSICKIVDKSGDLIAEVRRKQLSCGIVLGEDVLTMVVQPHVDHSLIMAIVIVYMHALMN
ncbi:hypothetical protein HS088_TW18G00773 [Tripterygium wilfordii]|uniref:Uncharacterized protein n=1 Tax=Tripterygium wilfordii TaxID=458696 RepID=A0A7J7CD45_TRIWF|nr:protein LURP-one-related 11-like [Tripterygium wilfordii]KAF5732084.1 hypothetical protein HS088_TW18G00773 [Tripterygium wilfordii]